MDIATCRLLARYNQWMNRKLIVAAAALPGDELDRDRGAFFGSVLGTLNHLVVADTIWLKRLSAHPSCAAPLAPLDDIPLPASLDARPCPTLDTLRVRRETLDALFVALCRQLDPAALWTRRWPTAIRAASRSAGAWANCCCTCSTTRPTTAGRPPPC